MALNITKFNLLGFAIVSMFVSVIRDHVSDCWVKIIWFKLQQLFTWTTNTKDANSDLPLCVRKLYSHKEITQLTYNCRKG